MVPSKQRNTKHHICSQKIDVIMVSLRTYYLPIEFFHVIAHTVYIPHYNRAKAAMSELLDVIDRSESSAPHASTISNGDFNNCNPKKSSEYLYQHIDCLTRGTATLDLLHTTNVKDAYKTYQLPTLQKADHNLINLVPQHSPIIQREKPRIISVQRRDKPAINHLRAETSCTDWGDMFVSNSCTDLGDMFVNTSCTDWGDMFVSNSVLIWGTCSSTPAVLIWGTCLSAPAVLIGGHVCKHQLY